MKPRLLSGMLLPLCLLCAPIGCSGTEEEPAAPVAHAPTIEDLGAGQLTSNGYVSEYFRFGVGFNDEWDATSWAEMRDAAARAGFDPSQSMRLLSLRGPAREHDSDDDLVRPDLKITVSPQVEGRSAREHLLEVSRGCSRADPPDLTAACRIVKDVHDVTLGGRTWSRIDSTGYPEFHAIRLCRVERERYIVIDVHSLHPHGPRDAEVVLSTLTFYD